MTNKTQAFVRKYYAEQSCEMDTINRQSVGGVASEEATGDAGSKVDDAAEVPSPSTPDAPVDGKTRVSQVHAGSKWWHSTPALESVLIERAEQDVKWGVQNWTPLEWLGILMEEVGEFSLEAVEVCVHGVKGSLVREQLRKECVQVAAVALAMVECLDRGEWDDRKD